MTTQPEQQSEVPDDSYPESWKPAWIKAAERETPDERITRGQ